jgi:hypothetical protein
MVFKITIEVDGREVETLEREIAGSPSDREEQVHQLAQQVERVMAQAALTEAAAEVRRPCCCGRSMENRDMRRFVCGVCRENSGSAPGAISLSRVRPRAVSGRCTAQVPVGK